MANRGQPAILNFMYLEPDLNTVLREPEPIENLARFIAQRNKPESFCLSWEDWNRRDVPLWESKRIKELQDEFTKIRSTITQTINLPDPPDLDPRLKAMEDRMKEVRDEIKLLRRDLSSSDPTKTGFFLVNERIPDVLDALRPVSLIGQLPMQVISGLTSAARLPRAASGTTGSTTIEYGASATTSESDPTFGSAGGLRPLRISTVTKYSRQLLAQAGGQGLSQLIKTDIARGIAFQMDQQIIAGNGIQNGQASGILNQASGSTVSTGFTFGGALAATLVSWQVWLKPLELMEAAFVRPDSWLLGPVTMQKARAIQRGAGQAMFLVHPDATSDGGWAFERIGKLPAVMTPYLATFENVLLGQWNLCYILVWGNGIEIIVDPYSAASTGEIQVTGNLMWNFCIRHPAAVAISTDSGAQ